MSDPDDFREFVDLEIFVEGLTSIADEERLRHTLDEVSGLTEVVVTHGRLDVRYDPISVTNAAITERIREAGFQITARQSAPVSPVINMDVSSSPSSPTSAR